MSELGDLLIGISVLLGAASSAYVLVRNDARGRKPERVAKSAAEETAAAVLAAIADGDLSTDELEQLLRRSLHQQQREGGDSP